MNICFNAVFDKIFLYHAIAQKLIKYNITIYWVIVNKHHYNFLKDNYPIENLLYLNFSEYKNKEDDPIDDYSINHMIYSDRILKYENYETAKKYLINIQKPVFNFIKNNSISFVIGEKNMAYQQMISQIIKNNNELNCKHLHALTIRLPVGFFAFFEDDFMSKFYIPILKYRKENNKSEENKSSLIVLETPDYVENVIKNITNKRSSLIESIKRVKKFIFNYDKDDPTILSSRTKKIYLLLKREINKYSYQLFTPKISLDELLKTQKKYVFIALHNQPEASIDVVGKFYEDQAKNIINIWKVLPCDWLLVVKEHRTAIGDRGYTYFNSLQKNKEQIVLVKETEDSHKLIAHSEMVITVSGTVAYEAILMNKPSLTFSETFFNKSSLCNKISLDDLRSCKTIKDLIPVYQNDKKEFEQWVWDNAFKGNIYAPSYSPECMNENNINLLTQAFLVLLKSKGWKS